MPHKKVRLPKTPTQWAGTKPLQPLLRRTRFQPGESLLSLLGRLELLNGYVGQDFLRQLCAESWPAEATTIQAEFPLNPASLLSLEVLTGIALPRLYAASHHFFANVLPIEPRQKWQPTGQKRPWRLGAFIQQYPFGRQGGAAFCPQCLQVGAYQRLAWIPRMVTVCLQHQCLLRDYCVACGRVVTLLELLQTTCGNCGANLTQGQPYAVAADTFGLFAQQVVQAWLGLVSFPQSPLAQSLPPATPTALLAFFERLQFPGRAHCGTLAQLFTARPTSLSPFTGEGQIADDYEQGVQAMRALVQWPDNWLGYLEVFRACYLPAAHYLPGNLSEWAPIWRAFPFAQKALRQARSVEVRTQPTQTEPDLVLAHPFRFIPLEQATQQTGLSQALLRRLAQVGLLRVIPAVDRYLREQCWFIEREGLTQLLHDWPAHLKLAEAATWLGLDPGVVQELLRLGLLQHGGGQSRPTRPTGILKQSVHACLTQVVTVACSTLPAVECIDSAGALRLLKPFGLTAGRLIQGVMQQQWRGALSKDWPAAGLAALGFRRSDLWTWAQAEAQRRGWLNRRELGEACWLTPEVLSRYLAAGNLTATVICGGLEYFDQRTLAAVKKAALRQL